MKIQGEVTIPANAIVIRDGEAFWVVSEEAPTDIQPLGPEWQDVGYVEES